MQNYKTTTSNSKEEPMPIKTVEVTLAEMNQLKADLLADGNKIPYVVCLIEDPDNKSYFQWTGSDFIDLGQTGGVAPSWSPTAITLGDLTVGAGTTISNNSGAGNYINFDSSSIDTVRINVSLDRNGMPYDGSDINVELYWMKFGNSGGTVKWELDYAFVDLSDDAYLAIDGTLTKSIDVTNQGDQELVDSVFDPISGNAGSKILQLTLKRISTGQGQDSYNGSAELYGFNLEK